MGNFLQKTRKAFSLVQPPGPPGTRWSWRTRISSARTMTRGGGKVRQPAGAPRLTQDLAAPLTARPPSPGTRSFPPPNIETARARPRSPEHPAPGVPQSRSPSRGSHPVSPETRQRTGSEGASGGGTGGIRRNSYGAPRLPECGCSQAREPAPAPRADHCRPLHLRAHTLSAPSRLGRRSDLEHREVGPGRCAARRPLQLPEAAPPVPTRRAAPQPTRVASGLSGFYLRAASRSSLLAPRSARHRVGRVRLEW